MRPLVILRPQPGASATATAAREAGLTPLVMPLFRIEPVGWRAPDPARFHGILLTSANAVRHAGVAIERLRGLPVHCVGEATAAAAREAELRIGSVGSGGIDELLGTLPAGLRLVHLCGAQWREARSRDHPIERIPVYDSVGLPRPKRFGEVEGAVAAVHSPRAASLFASHVKESGLRPDSIAIAAISAEAAKAAGSGWDEVEAAAEPSDTALLAIAARLCNNPG